MTEILSFLAAAVIGLTFAWSGIVKVVRGRLWLEALSVYRIPKPLEPLGFVAVPVAELAVAGSVLIGATKVAGALSVALLSAFCAALMRARQEEGDRLPCGCFGGRKVRDYRLLLLRNALLLTPACILLLSPSISIRTLPDAANLVPVVLVVSGVMVIGWTGFEVTRALKRGR